MFTATEEANELVNVVIVEDYKLTRVGLRSTINEFENITVIGEAEDAIQGLKIIEKEKPQVVLMDLGLMFLMRYHIDFGLNLKKKC